MNLENKTVAFLGDSITQGVGASENDKMYVEVFKKISKCNVLNYGISGTRFAKQSNPSENANYDLNFVSRVDGMEQNVDAVVVFGGTNDFGHGDAPFGSFGDETADTFCGACCLLTKKLVEKYPNVPIVFMTPLHRTTEDYLVNKIGIKRPALSEYVNIIRKTCEKFSVPVLDLFAMSGMQPNIKAQNDYYFEDGLHPNDNGHRRIAELLKNYLTYVL